jgi:hypothetical protein
VGINSLTIKIWVDPDDPFVEAGLVSHEEKTFISNNRLGFIAVII